MMRGLLLTLALVGSVMAQGGSNSAQLVEQMKAVIRRSGGVDSAAGSAALKALEDLAHLLLENCGKQHDTPFGPPEHHACGSTDGAMAAKYYPIENGFSANGTQAVAKALAAGHRVCFCTAKPAPEHGGSMTSSYGGSDGGSSSYSYGGSYGSTFSSRRRYTHYDRRRRYYSSSGNAGYNRRRYYFNSTGTGPVGFDCNPLSLACAPNHAFDPAIGGCVPCPHGTQRSTTSAKCTVCGAGQHPNYYHTGCTNCTAGTYKNATGHYCQYCPYGKVSPNGASTCTACAAGRTAGRRRYNPSYCHACPSGTYGTHTPHAGWGCSPCPNGKYSARSGSSSCAACPPGTVSLKSTGATSCGSFGRRLDASPCDVGDDLGDVMGDIIGSVPSSSRGSYETQSSFGSGSGGYGRRRYYDRRRRYYDRRRRYYDRRRYYYSNTGSGGSGNGGSIR